MVAKGLRLSIILPWRLSTPGAIKSAPRKRKVETGEGMEITGRVSGYFQSRNRVG